MVRPHWVFPWTVALAASAWAAQDPDSVSLRVRSDLVVLDLVATDAGGNFVADLTPAELLLTENGRRQEITYFRLHDHWNGTSGPDAADLLPGDPVDFAAPTEAARLIFVLDLQTIGANELIYSRRQINEFLDRYHRPGRSYMLATVGFDLKVRTPLAEDVEALRRELDRLPLESDSRVDETRFAGFMEEIEPFFQVAPLGGLFALQPAESAVLVARGFLQTLEQRVARVTAGCRLLMRLLRPLPGRKHVVLFSGGYPSEAAQTLKDIIRERMHIARPNLASFEREQMSVLLGQLQNLNLQGELRQIIDEANRSQVSLYCVDARGLIPAQGAPEAHRGRSGLQHRTLYHRFAGLDISSPQDFLVGLSSESGGVAFLNSNDLTKGMVQALSDASRYYLLAYRPQVSGRSAKYRRIRLESTRPGLRLRYRRGYLAADDPSDALRSDILAALHNPELFRDFEVRVEIREEGAGATVTTHVPTRALAFARATEPDMYRCPLETYGVLVDLRTGKWLDGQLQFAKVHELRVNSRQLERVRQVDYVSSESALNAPPGAYLLIVVVRQSTAGRIAAWSQPLELAGPVLER